MLVKDSSGLSGTLPLKVTRRKKRGKKSGRTLIQCGCCDQKVEVFHEDTPSDFPDTDTLEINGVMGTVEQWQQILLPLLNLEIVE